jgi:hypothetical protein
MALSSSSARVASTPLGLIEPGEVDWPSGGAV